MRKIGLEQIIKRQLIHTFTFYDRLRHIGNNSGHR